MAQSSGFGAGTSALPSFSEGQPFGRIGGIEGLVGAARLQDGERGHDRVFVAVQDDGDDASGLDDAGDMGGEVVRQFVELCVGQQGALEDDGGMAGKLGRILPEEFQRGYVRVERDGGGIEPVHFIDLGFRGEFQFPGGSGLLHGPGADGEAVCELPEDAFGIPVRTVENGHLLLFQVEGDIRSFGQLHFLGGGRASEMDGTVQFQVFRCFVVGVGTVLEGAFKLLADSVRQLLERRFRGPFYEDRALRGFPPGG